MSFRVILIESEVDVKLKLNNLIIDKGEGEVWVPLSDISMLVIDNLKISITSRMMCALADAGIGVIFCNQVHQPIGIFNAYSPHSRGVKVLEAQIRKTKDEYDLMWAETIRWKIRNQAMAMELIGLDKERSIEVRKMSESVNKGDITNREAHAAKLYFNTMMGVSFSRGNTDILLNSGLDYGYSIIRSFITRLCAGYGLNCQLGMHHKSEYNTFNLADDLIEPIRPFVDVLAYTLLKNEEYFKRDHRLKLINILNHRIKYQGKKMYLCNVLEEYIKQYSAWVQDRCESIVFPDISNYLGESDEV